MEFFTQYLNPETISQYAVPLAINLGLALVIFFVGRFIAKMVVKGLGKIMKKSGVDETLASFLGKIAYAALLVAVAIAALGQLGVDTTSALAIFAVAGLAIGFALQDTLSNFAAGVMLILFKPFKQGDFVEAGGSAGIVDSINIFSTIMHTGDNREIIIPNAQIYGGTITNVSARETRRIDLTFGIGYGDDIRKAKELIEATIAADLHILRDPAPTIAVAELADSSVNIIARPWVKAEDYWTVQFSLLEKVKTSFDAHNISIPFPQQDVHMHQDIVHHTVADQSTEQSTRKEERAVL